MTEHADTPERWADIMRCLNEPIPDHPLGAEHPMFRIVADDDDFAWGQLLYLSRGLDEGDEWK